MLIGYLTMQADTPISGIIFIVIGIELTSD